MSDVLVLWSAARQALVQARDIDEVKDVRDKAEALRLYAKQRGESHEMQNNIAEIKLRAERRAGELLAETVKAGNPQLLHDETISRLPEGISRVQSHRWQKAAQLPEEEFEEHIARTKARGGELTSAGVHRLVKQTEKEIAIERRKQAKDGITEQSEYSLYIGDLTVVGSEIANNSVDFVITDPPYGQKYLPLYGTLSELAVRVLKPGGSLLVMAGQSYIAKTLFQLNQYLTYHWTLAYLTPGPKTAIWPRKVHCSWKPIFWFVKGEYKADWINDIVTSPKPDKKFHNWGQSTRGMIKLLHKFCYPNQVILDPFCGAGTTGLAALELGCHFIGIDIDPEQIRMTRTRLEEWIDDQTTV